MAAHLRSWIQIALCMICYPLVVYSYKYLQFTPGTFKGVGSKSHFYIAGQLASALKKGGHEVTLVVTGDNEETIPGVNIVKSPAAYPDETFIKLGEMVKDYTKNQALGIAPDTSESNLFMQVLEGQCYALLTDTDLFMKLTAENFDYAIVDHYHGCGYLFAKMLGLRYMALECSTSISMLMDSQTSHPLAYVPTFATEQTDRMTFIERVKNTLMWPTMVIMMHKLVDAPTIAAQERAGILPGTNFMQLRQEAELWLVNNDWSLEFPRPTNPNTIFIGGILAAKEPKPISKDLQSWLSTAPGKGTVIVSFGSAMDVSDMPDIQKLLFDAFRALPYKVIFSLKAKVNDIPPNVKVMDWIPQSDLLALKDETKLLVTHGGVNSIYEAIYWAVPVLILPLTMDAPDNAARVVAKGFGLKADFKTLTSEELAEKITTLIEDKSFKQNAEKASRVMRDTPQTPAERVLFWVEHITRHGNGDHIHTKTAHLHWWQHFMWDVAAFLIVLTITLLWIIFMLVKCTCRCCCKCLGFSKQPAKEKES